ncbi:MAG: hypothetical protein JXX28_04995 [Deltaproteobacteria bacterium]|nr:hypothetical protein [Deltaproteobacteria bacterium]
MPIFDPTTRLDRWAAGDTIQQPGSVVVRLDQRLRDEPVYKVRGGETIHLSERKTRRARHIGEPNPYAPQLIRVIKSPAELDAAPPTKGEGRPAVPWSDLSRARLVGASAQAKQARGAVTEGNPLRGVSRRPQAREAVPSVELWLGGRR